MTGIPIGVIGGMTPASTALFYNKIIEKCQSLYKCRYDSDYPEIFIHSIPIPDIIENISDSKRTVKMLRESVRKLEMVGVGVIVIPCNTSHIFFEDIEGSTDLPVLNIVEETAKKLKESGIKKVGLLTTEATFSSGMYNDALERFGVRIVLPVEEDKKSLTKVIVNICGGKLLQEDKEFVLSLVENMAREGSEGVIVGCTDLPLLLSQEDTKLKLFDTLDILAESTVRFSFGDVG